MILEVKDYNKTIKGKEILKNINLRFDSGHVYGFYGRNGSGKTMLFRAITTLIFPTSGDVLVDGKSVIKEDFDLSQIGILIETPGFYSYLTGFQNLSMLYTINHKKDDAHIHSILKKMGLEDAANKKYKEYSLGMKQRLRIAQAIMEDQKILIFDEPTNGIDADGLQDIYKIIQEEREKGKLILLSSHNKEDLKYLCDDIYTIAGGEITGKLEGDKDA